MFEHIQSGPGDFPGAQAACQGILVNHLTTGCVHNHSRRFQQLQTPRVHQMKG
jgi:hypothetical protein